MKAEELLRKMPKNYREIKYKTYIEILNNVMVDKPETMEEDDFKFYQSFSMISILLDIPYPELEALPLTTSIQLLNCLKFMDVEIQETYSNYKVKDSETLTFKDFQSLIKMVPNQWENMDDILEIMIQDLTKEEIQNLSVYDASQVFFCLKRYLLNYLNRTQKSLGWKILKMEVQQKVKKMLNRKVS